MSINCCLPFGTREAGMWAFYLILGLFFWSVFIGGFKQGWRQENILRRARGITRAKLMEYGEIVAEFETRSDPTSVHKLIEGRRK